MSQRNSWWKQSKIPIAWLLLARFRVKLFTALIGIVFASILLHAQLGLRSALFESSISIFKTFNADIVVISKVAVGSTSLQSFDRNRLVIFDRYPEVVDTTPVRYDFVRWRYAGSRESRLAIMLGFDPRLRIFNQEDILKNQSTLLLPGRILYDELSRREFGPVKKDFEKPKPLFAFVNDQRARISGLVKLGTSFSYDASFLTSLSTFELLSDNKTDYIEIGLVKLFPGTDAVSFLRRIQANLPSDVQAYTLQDFLDFEKGYWDRSKPIGFIFAFNAVLGFTVGMLILYQILYTDVSNHLSDFSTMLALAFTYKRIRLIVFQESLFLAVIGYPIGVFGSVLLFELISSLTGLPVRMSTDRVLICFLIVLLMSSCSALMAMRKLDDANPIEVFE